MPAPVSSTVFWSDGSPSRWTLGGVGPLRVEVRNEESADIAPGSVDAEAGRIIGGGRAPVQGMRIRGLDIEETFWSIRRRGGRW